MTTSITHAPTTATATNPATLEPIGTFPQFSEHDVDTVVRQAAQAFPEWKKDWAARQKLLAAVAEQLETDRAQIIDLLSREQGKTLFEAGNELTQCIDLFRYYSGQEQPVEYLPERTGRKVRVVQQPYGVVAAIIPWNFPLMLMTSKIAPALLAGNAVVVKASDSTAMVSHLFLNSINKVLPQDVLLGVTGRGTGKALSEHRLVRKLSFTGSTETGKAIMEQAARNLIPVTLELGGNDPAILLGDANVEAAADALAASCFRNAGQICAATKRIYLPADIHDRFVERFAQKVSDIRVGSGSDKDAQMGPVHSKSQYDIVMNLLNDAIKRGAEVVVGGGKGTELPGYFIEPTVVSGLDDSAPLVSEEQFGPVLPVVTYTDLAAVIETLNSQEYGLGASVWTADPEAAESLAEQLQVGTVWINRTSMLELDAPFGGWKASGMGRERGRWGLEAFLQPTTINTAK